MEKKYMTFKAEIKAAESDNDKIGKITGYASAYGVKDSYGDIVQKGAFARSLKEYGLPSMLLQHNSWDVAGIWVKATEDDTGLLLEGELNLEVQKAREAYALAKQGALKGLSIGFYTKECEYDDDGTRNIKDVDLIEVSLVTFPANREATITDVKNAPKTERELERYLRDAGYSATQAKTIVSKGFKALDASRDAEESEILKALNKTVTILNGASQNGNQGTN